MKLKQSEKSGFTRERILKAAEAEFAEKGFYGARVDAIAEASGVNKRMIYAHFESKEKLYTKALLIMYERLAECEREFIVDNLDPMEAISGVIHVSFKYLLENPSMIRMLMWENLNRGKSVPEEDIINLKAPSFDYIKRQLRRGIDMGIFRNDIDEHHMVLSLMNFCFSYFSNIYTMSVLLGRDMANESEVLGRADFITDMIFKYLSA